MEELPDHVLRNRTAWDGYAAEYVEMGRHAWQAEPSWGIWSVSDTELNVLPDDLSGLDTIELGCGTAYVSAWLARRGARPVGIDNSEQQLRSARAFQQEFGLEFPLRHGNAERVPAPDASFDLAISEYGASIWCDPYLWIPEAARLLRPGRRLIFLVNGVIAVLTFPDEPDAPAGETLQRPYFGMHRFEWPGDEGVNFLHPARRDDRVASALRVRRREADRGPPARRIDDQLSARHARVGAAMAVRGDLDRAQAGLTRHPRALTQPPREPGSARRCARASARSWSSRRVDGG